MRMTLRSPSLLVAVPLLCTPLVAAASRLPSAPPGSAPCPNSDQPPWTLPAGAWRGVDDTAAWVANVRTNLALPNDAAFWHERFLPLLRSETLDRFAAGPDRDKPWAAEARDVIDEAIRRAWGGRIPDRAPNEWGRPYDFTVREGSRDPFLRWMSILGQKRWHWDAQAREQLEAFEADLAALGNAAHPFDRFLAAHARHRLDDSQKSREALRAAAVAWAESHAGNPADSAAVYTTLNQFGLWNSDLNGLAVALLDSRADPWIGEMLRAYGFYRARDDAAARALYASAWRRHPEFVESAIGMLQVMARSDDRSDRDVWFRRGLDACIDDDNLYRAYADTLVGGGIEDFTPILRLAEACRDTQRHDIPVAYKYVPLIARYRHLADIPQKEFFNRRDVFRACDETLQRQMTNPDASPAVRQNAATLLAAILFLHGDLDDALDVASMRTPNTYNGILARYFDDWLSIMTIFDGLSDQNGDIIRPLYDLYFDGHYAACLEQWEDVWSRCYHIADMEADLLMDIAMRSWLEVGYAAGTPWRLGVLHRRKFVGWINHGWNLEEDGDEGSAFARDGGTRHLRVKHPVPRAIEVAGAFAPYGALEGSHSLAVRLIDRTGVYAYYGPQPDLVMMCGMGQVGVRIDRRDGKAAPWEWHPVPTGPIRFRAVYHGDGAVELWLDAVPDRPVLSAKLPDYAPDRFPDRGSLIFVGNNVRFLGCTLVKPR